jgi:hypothetical protein
VVTTTESACARSRTQSIYNKNEMIAMRERGAEQEWYAKAAITDRRLVFAA